MYCYSMSDVDAALLAIILYLQYNFILAPIKQGIL